MKQNHKYHWLRSALFNAGLASITGLCAPSAHAAFGFTGVAAGDATSDSVILWTRAADDASPGTASVTMSTLKAPHVELVCQLSGKWALIQRT